MIGPQGTDLDVFYTLPDSLGEKWDFEHLHMERERFTLELLADVQPIHEIRNAIVVIVPSAPNVDAYLRLGIANAWRAGVRRFILLFADKSEPSASTCHELEQELRVLLDSLGDGGAAPAVYAALTRCAGGTKTMRDAMLRLLDEIERVFPPDDDAPVIAARPAARAVMIAARPAARAVMIAEPLPASFAAETAVLDAIAPLIRSGTMLQTRGASLEDTAALRDGSGGSHRGGWPYLPISEAWPTCPRCKRQIPCFMQFDMRDVLHDPPPSHALFVIYRCRDCYSPDNVVVRHYPTPSAAERRPIDLSAPLSDDHEIFVMERRAHMLPDYEIVEADHPDVLAKLRAIDQNCGRLYWWAESALGLSSHRIPDHLGGWQTSQYASVPTCACDEKLYLVSSTQWGDYWNSIWACPIHPDLTQHTFHK